MTALTKKERETVLVLVKDFTSFYNANSISKILAISHVGAQKILKRLLQENIVTSKTIGKMKVYKPCLNDAYASHLVTFLLADEANNSKRWKEEFKEVFKKKRIVILFGSAVKNYANARDIDLMVVLDDKDRKEVQDSLKKKRDILPKELHAIVLSHHDFVDNLKKENKVMVDIVKNGIVLYGQENYTEALNNVAGF